jgi:hypothetical protein
MKPVEQARKQLEAFEGELNKETGRRKREEEKLEASDRKIGEADPDQEGTFAKLIGERDLTRARVKALEVREQRAREQRDRASAEYARVESADRIVEAKTARQRMASAGAALNTIAADARERLIVSHRDFAKRVDEFVALYNALPAEVRDEIGPPGSASAWAQVYLGHGVDLLEVAARLTRGSP